MRFVIIVALAAISFGAGYFTHSKLADRSPDRADRAGTDAATARSEVLATLSKKEREDLLKRSYPELYPELIRLRDKRDAGTQPEQPDETEESAAGDEGKDDQIAAWLRSASSQWKAFAAMQAKNKVRGLLAGLDFDPETAKQIEDAIVADVERQVERAVAMMLGEEEIDESAFASMLGIPPDLSAELEKELAGYLGDEEIGSVRERVQAAHQKQMTDMADMQINTMGIRDLSDDQQKQMREVFVGRDMMSRQMSQMADLTRNRKRMIDILQDEDAFSDLVKKNMEPQRRRVRDILNDEQYKRYEVYEKNMLQQARMGMKMMSAMMKPKK